jgi:predicted nuclease of predicted toxin-antitoxin system
MKPALITDENISVVTARLLRAAGFDVFSVAESDPASDDIQVLAMARSQERWLVTFDRDFGDLVFNLRLAPPPGIVYQRFSPLNAEEPVARIVQALETYADTRAFVVVSRDAGMRMRLLPDYVG